MVHAYARQMKFVLIYNRCVASKVEQDASSQVSMNPNSQYERRRLTELYAGMTDGELEQLAADGDSLTTKPGMCSKMNWTAAASQTK